MKTITQTWQLAFRESEAPKYETCDVTKLICIKLLPAYIKLLNIGEQRAKSTYKL
jgi:hypothetical protein